MSTARDYHAGPKPTSVRLDQPRKDAVKALAARAGMSAHAWIIAQIDRGIAEQRKEAA